MGFETIPGTDIRYGLISFDADGRERREGNGLFSDTLLTQATREPITNVFFFCHGWRGDMPAARAQYNSWLGALMASPDRQAAAQRFPGFTPLLVGLHWPSEPWGDEEGGAAAFGANAAAGDALLQAYLERLGDRPEIRRPLEVIFAEARHNAAPEALPPHVRQAYLDLNEALGLKSEGVGAPPDADREGFDPDESFDAANEEGANFGAFSLGGLLGPLRQLSYWRMKQRARTVGEGGMHEFLKTLQKATAERKTAIHLMGHSFGTVVVSGMLGGPDAQGSLPRPVDSVVLVQGAVSLWCYAPSIPFRDAGAGYFTRILADGKVRGPIVTTRSRHDSAVGRFYPLASRINGSASFAPGLPEYGAVGTFGLQGVPDATRIDTAMLPATGAYAFERGKVYNLEASQYIARGDGASGAHGDIAGPEVAHAIWAAAFAATGH
jgi:hypothetical protein